MWGRQSYRLSDLDFEANAKDGIAVDWPIRYKDICRAPAQTRLPNMSATQRRQWLKVKRVVWIVGVAKGLTKTR